MACRIWGLRSTDIMQGVVYGARSSKTPPKSGLATRFDFDHCFGTVINRFCAQAVIGMPLTPYGKGGQKRGFLPLRDSMACLTLALEHPAEAGEYRTFNQFDQVYSVNQIAETVQRVGKAKGLDVRIQPIANPRVEEESHEYRPDADKLRGLGYKPSRDLAEDIGWILDDLTPYRDRIARYRETLAPKIPWDAAKLQPN